MEKQIFRSRVSVLLTVLIFSILVLPLIWDFSRRDYLGIYLWSGMLLFFALMFFGMRYIITENKLSTKVFWIIPFGSVNITDIISVERSYNLISSPAASLKRLHIHTKGALLLISPVREQEFFDTLMSINPDIRINVDDKKHGNRIRDWDI